MQELGSLGMDGTRVAQWLEICCPAVLMTRPTRCDSGMWIPYDTGLCSSIKPASFRTDKIQVSHSREYSTLWFRSDFNSIVY